MKQFFSIIFLLVAWTQGYSQKTTFADSPILNFDLSHIEQEEDIMDLLDTDGTNYLLIIACDNYSSWKPLVNPVKDAEDLKNTLIKKYNFDFENVFELYNEEVTAAKVREAFEKIKEQGSGNDNLLIYFSGHGYYDPSFDKGYWIPQNGKLGEVSTYIPNSNILNYIKALSHRHIFMIADACFSGAMFADGNRGYLEKVEQVQSRWGLSSGNIEYVSDGKEGENSPFAFYLLKFLNDNLKDRFAVSELIQYVKVAVADNTPQTPIGNPLKGVGNEGGEFIFYHR